MSVYQHYREEERVFIDQILSWKEQVERNFIPRMTDFLNPREQRIALQLIGETNDDIQIQFFGGGTHTERKKAIIAPYYEEVSQSDFEITLLETRFPEKFVTISHRDVMGAFLSLGIDRKKLGDIHVDAGVVQIITSLDISPFVLANLTTIKNANVRLQSVPLANLLLERPDWKIFDRTVSSLRFDAVLKEIYNLSRKDAANYIEQKRARINHKTVDDIAYMLEPEDLISVRGKGRSKLISKNGLSRKGRNRITVAILK